ncbi:MAG: hypothetical protein ACP5LB_03870 [Candidatus Bathyarchaeia archaeon]
MLRIEVAKKGKALTGVCVLVAVLLAVLFASNVAPVKSAYSSVAKPMEFYFHYSDVPVTVAGLETKYIVNTTRAFRFMSQEEAYANSFYKEVGLPKIAVDFYLYPNLAGSVTLNGTWQVFIWANASAYKPTIFTVQFREITVGGVVLWDSGALNPTVTSSIGSYVDVPVYNYNLSTSLTHTFTAGTTVHVHVEVNAGSSTDTRIWYDSPLYPSKVILPAEDYARPSSIKTYTVDNSETTLFYYNWSESQRNVIIRTNVTDPFGGYDVYKVNLTVIDPTGTHVINNMDMVRTSDGQWAVNYAHIYEANWSYPSSANLGNYTVIVTVIDNNGYYNNIDTGTFDPFIEEDTYTFAIGIIVYYDPTFLVTDDTDAPLPEAQVYITWPNGTTETIPQYTSTSGFINLTHVLSGNYGFTVLWKDIVVAQTTMHVDTNGPYTIKTQVYQLTVQVFGNNGIPIHGAYVIVYTQSGVGFGLDTTDATGKALFKLPPGDYKIEAHYVSDYWLTVVKASATEPVSVTATTSKNIILADYPPSIWSTIGFLILIAVLIAIAITITFVLYIVRKKLHKRRL